MPLYAAEATNRPTHDQQAAAIANGFVARQSEQLESLRHL